MNIALIIFPIHASHGCILQTYALASTLKQMGHKVTIIDRQWDKPSFVRVCKHAARVLASKITRGYEGGFTDASDKKIIMSELQTFVDKHLIDRVILYSNPRYDDLSKYDAFVVGSDQTWRPKYVSDVTYYYLGFVLKEAKVKRLAYAPSFGTDEWEYSPELTATCKELIERFDAISVREESGVSLCKEHFGIDVKHVLDPTMLLSKEDYLTVCSLEMHDNNVLSYYMLDNSDSKMAIVNKVCSVLNLQNNRINTETENGNAPLYERVAPSIEKWISGFAHSKFIITDSFHATVFAIIFNRPFITIANAGRGLTRFLSLLEMVGLEHRMVFNSEDITEDLLYEQIDWKSVNDKLKDKRQLSINFLYKSLQK